MCFGCVVRLVLQEEACSVSYSSTPKHQIHGFDLIYYLIVFRSQDDYDLREFKLVTEPPDTTKVDGNTPDPAEERALAQEYAVSAWILDSLSAL